MSVKITSQVWDRRYSSHAKKLVLLALGDFSNDAGYSWPSIETVARKADCSPRHARRMIQELQVEGVLCAHRDGRRNVYLVTLGQNDGQLRASLRRYFRYTEEQARERVAEIRAAMEAKIGDTVSPIESRIEDTVSPIYRTPCPLSGQETHEYRTSETEIGDTVSPYPSVTIREPSREPSVDPSCSVGLSDPSEKLGQAESPLQGAEAQWAQVLERLRGQMARSTFEPYLAGSRVVSADESAWQVALPSEAAVEMVTGRLAPTVARTMVRVGCPIVRLDFLAGGGGS